jgi:WhiB family redox-sensing transcriptional regulator
VTRKLPAHALLGTATPSDWRDDAACRGINPERFFPHESASDLPAKRICHGCPVRLACLEDALAAGKGLQGVYGGLSHAERSNVIRQRQRIRADERPDRAIAMYRTLRPGAQSDYATHVAIGAALAVHPRTVAKWCAGIDWEAAQGG